MKETDVVIIGAGPTGLFAVHQLGIIGLSCEVIDNLNKPGGQCIELYPDKPIFDIPAIPECTGEELTKNLLKQIEPFKKNFHLNERVQVLKQDNDQWLVETNKGNKFKCSSIIIAGGVGSFEPRKISLTALEKFENKQVFYSISNKSIFKDQIISIFGGGDSALDWAVELSKTAKKVYLIHRRNEFRGAQHTLDQIKTLEKSNKVILKTPFQIEGIKEAKKLESISIKNEEGKVEEIQTDFVLGFFGLIMKLGPILDWGLNIDKKTVAVNTETFETNKKGIFAIGDICTYPGKLKLILSGFHEGALAARACFTRARPNEKYRFEFTTSSKTIQERLKK